MEIFGSQLMQVKRMRMDCKVYVGNLGNNAAKHELESAFTKYGPLVNVWVARNPPGFAFVEFEDPRDAEDAVRALDGTRLCGVRVRVEMSTGRSRRDRYRSPSRRGPALPEGLAVLVPGHQDAHGPAPPGLFHDHQGMMITADEVTLQTSEDVPDHDHRKVCTHQRILDTSEDEDSSLPSERLGNLYVEVAVLEELMKKLPVTEHIFSPCLAMRNFMITLQD
ncbi:RNA-binding protein 1-like [Homarus americanus]|uniref:RNA-binding protein 1-like n=1 Tax=Homarus americanus TaxID=6706 RepID=A0A8J5NBR3_HOMAM|nr:RNA-binding protein 1-like [Homarus americanus]